MAEGWREHVRDRIKSRRGELDMRSQAALAEAAGVSESTVRRLERGLSVSVALRARIEDALRWERGSVRRLFLGEEPSSLPDGTASETLDEPDPHDYSDTMDYLHAVYWYLRKQGMSHAAVMRGFRLASAVYLDQRGDK